MNNKIVKILDCFSEDPIKKLKIYVTMRNINQYLHYGKSQYLENRTLGLLPGNQFYGHEYWLKRYSGYQSPIYGLIEHGLVFGNNMIQDGIQWEWQIGSILTFGENRYQSLKKYYPNYNIQKIGPRIYYVDCDREYYHSLKGHLLHKNKTLVAFPFHTLSDIEVLHDRRDFINSCKSIAEMNNCENIVVCIHPSDYKHGVDKIYEELGCMVVSGGVKPREFLPRLKAILSLADVTVSNGIGTHIGYSVYMHRPHIMIKQQVKEIYDESTLRTQGIAVPSENIILKNERELFFNVFKVKEKAVITKEQLELCDEYWGFSDLKKADELKDCLEQCREFHMKHKRSKNG